MFSSKSGPKVPSVVCYPPSASLAPPHIHTGQSWRFGADAPLPGIYASVCPRDQGGSLRSLCESPHFSPLLPTQ